MRTPTDTGLFAITMLMQIGGMHVGVTICGVTTVGELEEFVAVNMMDATSAIFPVKDVLIARVVS